MPPKPVKPKGAAGYKAAALVKDILPPSVKNPPREGRSVKVPDAAAIQANQQAALQLNASLFEEFPKMEEWPGDEAAKAFDFGLESNTPFVDSSCNPFKLLSSFSSDNSNLIFWRRPSEFVQTEQEEISRFQNKYQLKRRTSQMVNLVGGLGEFSNQKLHEDYQISPTKIFSEEKKIQVKVFEYYEREESAQEFEARKKEQLQAEKADKDKKAKKPGKKEENDDKPGTIKDVKLNNIDMAQLYPSDSKWIASQLQLIKDRQIQDCFTNKPIWTKIYPQQDGIPILNKSGRYWVKLYSVGKERKIEIDDKMPVNFKGQCKFPRSVKKEEIWSCLFSKAIFKLIQMTQDISQIQSLCGSGFVLYSLAGMLSQTIPMQIQSTTGGLQEWQQKLTTLREMLSDKHFVDQDIILTCYCTPEFSSKIEKKTTEGSQNSKGEQHSNRIQEGFSKIIKEESAENENKSSLQSADPAYSPLQGSANHSKQNNSRGDQIQDEGNYALDTPQKNAPFQRKNKRHLTSDSRSLTHLFDPALAAGLHEENEDNISPNNSQPGSPSKLSNSMKIAVQKASNILKQAISGGTSTVISGFSYPITECFFNDTFNMVYVQKKSDKEIKLRQDYMEHCNLQMNKMNKEEKIEHRRKKKELRDRIADEEKKKIELITRPPIQHKFFRLKTGAGRVPQLNINSPFTAIEIQIAKTCILNRLNKPPNYQEGVELRDDGKSVVSSAVKNADESFQSKPLEDFSSINECIEPMDKGTGGVWVLDGDLYNYFQYFQVFYNPCKYQNHKNITVPQSPDSEITIGEDHEVLLVERNSERENQDEKVMLLFSFSSKESKTAKIIPMPYCILQKFDFGQFSAIHEFPPLKGNENSLLAEIENSNQVFKVLVYTPVSFSLSISCTNTFQTMPILTYLTEYEGFQAKNFAIEYQAMEEKKVNLNFLDNFMNYYCFEKYHALFRIKIPQQEFESLFLLKIKSTTDNQMLKYLRLKLVEEDTEGMGVMLNTIEGVEKNLYENTFTLSSYLRISIREKTNYYLVLEGEPPYAVAEGTLNVDIYTKNNDIPFENLEHVDPLQYFDRYIPTKYGIIFREKIYAGEQTIASFHLKIMEVIGASAANQAAADPKKKGGKPQGDISDLQEKELEAKRLIKLELFENGKSIIYNTGHNSTLLSNVILKSTKTDEVQYLLEATFDLRDWPEAKTLNALTEGIHWFLKVISTETVGIVRDTDKEDKEKAIKKSWEDGEAGRSEKAKKSRRKFQIFEKSQAGENLTEEEIAILNEPRLTKKQRDEAQAANAGGKKQAKKEDKKPAPPAKGGKAQEVVEEKKEARPLPVSSNHQSKEIKEFLEHMEKDRVMEELADHPGLIEVRSEENKQQLKLNAELAKQQIADKLAQNTQLREKLKQYQQDQLKQMEEHLSNERAAFRESWTKFQSSREEIKGKMGAKTQKERELIEILKVEKPTIGLADLEKLVSDAHAIPEFSPQLLEIAKKLTKNLKILALTEKMQEGVGNFNVESLTSLMEDFTKYCVTGIDAELIKKIEEILAEAKENPNFLAEKQAEQKKGGKKGKK